MKSNVLSNEKEWSKSHKNEIEWVFNQKNWTKSWKPKHNPNVFPTKKNRTLWLDINIHATCFMKDDLCIFYILKCKHELSKVDCMKNVFDAYDTS